MFAAQMSEEVVALSEVGRLPFERDGLNTKTLSFEASERPPVASFPVVRLRQRLEEAEPLFAIQSGTGNLFSVHSLIVPIVIIEIVFCLYHPIRLPMMTYYIFPFCSSQCAHITENLDLAEAVLSVLCDSVCRYCGEVRRRCSEEDSKQCSANLCTKTCEQIIMNRLPQSVSFFNDPFLTDMTLPLLLTGSYLHCPC